jgi:cysteine dioxygenase
MSQFEAIRKTYFEKDLSYFQQFITPDIAESHTKAEYFRVPVYEGECMVILMLWGPGSTTAIHDHAGSRGSVKVLHGTVKEERFLYKNGELKCISSVEGTPGAVLHVSSSDLHAVSNPTSERSISVHVYDTSSNSLAGTTIYDPEQKRIGVLNDKATRSSWAEKAEAFSKVIPF